MNDDQKHQEEIATMVAQSINDPVRYSQGFYPWGEGQLEGSPGPRSWQNLVNTAIRDHLANPKTMHQPLRIAVASGHGIGKSGEVGMLIDWGLKMPDTKVVVTASTDKQLKTKTWPEVEKWQKLSLTGDWFRVTATSIASLDPKHERTWRADAIPWNEEEPESFAGMHNRGKRILLIFDEASAIADKIWEVVEGALTDADTQIIWIAFGNPTRNTGRFKDCFGKFKHLWKTFQIDSRTVEGTNKDLLNQWVYDYGEDSDFVRVRVRGEFPRAGNMQFISGDIVAAARKRPPAANLMDPCIMGVDVSRYGDDESVICIRRGRDAASVAWKAFRNVDTMTLAAAIVDIASDYKPDAIFVDEGGVGGGVVDRLNMLRQPVIGVNFGSKADRGQYGDAQQVRYANKSAEMWGGMRDWLKGGMIPDDPDLASQLCDREYGYVLRDGQDAIMLEKKEDMKKRGLSSPDRADALALTFAYPVLPSDHTTQFEKRGQQNVQIEYNPLTADAARGR